MPKKKSSKKKSNKKVVAGIGLGLALAAAAGAIYAFSGEKGKKRRDKVSKWAGQMKKDAINELRLVKKISKPAYDKIVDKLTGEYAKLSYVNSSDVKEIAKELKAHWKHISAGIKEAGKELKPKKAKGKSKAKK